MCELPRRPSQFPFPLDLSPWAAFMFDVAVVRAARLSRQRLVRRVDAALGEKDLFGTGKIGAVIAALYERR